MFFLGKFSKVSPEKVREKKNKNKNEFTTFRLFGPTGSLKNSRIPKNI
jgi:hypothetical protein